MTQVTTVEDVHAKTAEMRKAQEIFAQYSQEQVDAIFRAVAMEGNRQGMTLAKMAVEETGMGILEDKAMKNHYAAEFVYHKYRCMKTCGVVEDDPALGIQKVADPIGIIGAIIPITNPTSTAIFQILICLKTRNAILISPHPGAKRCTVETVRRLARAAYAAGAPAGVIDCIEEPTKELSGAVMASVDTILATGGPDLIQAAYASGKPAIGAGSGNCPAIVDETADIRAAVYATIHSKTFDSGIICASEQSLIVVGGANYQEVKREFVKWGAHILTADEMEQVKAIILCDDGAISPAIVGRKANEIAKLAGLEVPEKTKVLIGEVTAADSSEPFAREKLSPLLALYQTATFERAVELAADLIRAGGAGHTAALWIDPHQKARIKMWYTKLKACRLIVNSPASQGAIGGLYNVGLAPSLTLSCGSWGGNACSDNIGPMHLLNIKTVAVRRENMLELRLPHRVYFKRGCTPAALKEWKEVYDCKRVFVITDHFLYQNGTVQPVLKQLEQMGLQYASFYDLNADPTLQAVQKGLSAMEKFQPDGIIGMGGGSALDAAKLMWYAYEHPEAALETCALTFPDIRRKSASAQKSGKKAVFAAISTGSGTGSEQSPFVVRTDAVSGSRCSIADYALLPTVSIVDADHMMDLPKGLTRASGLHILARGMEAYVSLSASDYTDGFALTACKNVFQFLPRAYDQLGGDVEARIKMADAAALAGIASANAFPGLNHAMALQLSAWHHLPHGISNALLLLAVMEYNAQRTPEKMGTFSQYQYPHARERYAEIAAFCGFGGKTVDESYGNLCQKVAELKTTLELYPCIQAYGIDEAYFLNTLDAMNEAAWSDQAINCNPVYPLLADMRALYLRCYYGEAQSDQRK